MNDSKTTGSILVIPNPENSYIEAMTKSIDYT